MGKVLQEGSSVPPTGFALLPSSPSFAGHQTFAIRSGWLKKGMDAIQNEKVGGPKIFGREDALVSLGVGKNMVQAIRHWILATRIAEEQSNGRGKEIYPTRLGKSIFGDSGGRAWDPFLEDTATLWLLHWQLAGPNSSAFSWIWTFNGFREYEFSRETITSSIYAIARARLARAPAIETISRDVECLLHTYVATESNSSGDDSIDCPLRELGLIRPTFDRSYRFEVGPKPALPAVIVDYALLCFWDAVQSGSKTLPVREIAFAEGSPGLVFKLDEDSVLEYLDGLEGRTHGRLRFEDTALTRQVVRDDSGGGDPVTLLEGYYCE